MMQKVLEGTWEDILRHSDELSGRWVTLTVSQEGAEVSPNERPLAILREIEERQTARPYTSGDDTQRRLRQARGEECMVLNPSRSSRGAVVIDANVTIAISAREAKNGESANAELANYSNLGYSWYASGAIIPETLYILCQKFTNLELTPLQHTQAVRDFDALMSVIQPPPNGDASLIERADQIRSSYGCSRSADNIYIALAEELSQIMPAYLLTFDAGLSKQAAKNAPQVQVHLLTF